MANTFDWRNIPANKQIQQTAQPQTGAKNLFVNEKDALNNMINAGIQESEALKAITERRKSMLGKVSQQEGQALIKMANDGIDITQAVKAVKENRKKNLPLWKKAAKIPFNLSVGATSLAAEQVGNLFDFATGGQVPYFKEQVKGIQEVTGRSFEGEIGFQAGRNILGAGEMVAIGPTKIAPTLGGRIGQGATVGGVFGAGTPILEKGADVTPGEILKGGAVGATIGAVATPILEKAVLPIISKTIQKTAKYGTAGIKGGAEGLKKSIVRDIKAPFKRIKLEGLAPQKAASLSTKANRFNATDIEKFKRITGESPGEFAVKRGMTKVGDEAVEEATNLYVKSMTEADDALKLIDGSFKIKKGPDFLGEMLTDLSSRLKKTIGTGGRKINLLLKKYNTKGLSMSEINEVKRLYSRNFKYSWLEAGSESALRSKNLQDGVRKWQFKTAGQEGLTNLKDINKTTQGWRTFADSLAKKLKRSSGNNNISLTDWIALSGGEPTNVALFLGKKVGELTPVKRGLIKTLGKQTKPSIIKADRESILKANLKKENVNIDRILSDRTSSVIPKSTIKPIIKKSPVKPKIIKPTKEKIIIPKEVPKKLEGLYKEAIKYDNADDFVNAMGKELGKSRAELKKPSNISQKVWNDRIALGLTDDMTKRSFIEGIGVKDIEDFIKGKQGWADGLYNFYKAFIK